MSYEEKDPKTVEALDKIKAILTEYDLWAAFVVVSEERVHWLYHFSPSWSGLYLDTDTGRAHFRAKRADFASPDQHQRVVEKTIGAVISTRDFAAKQFQDASALIGVIKKHVKSIEHTYSDPEYKSPKEEK